MRDRYRDLERKFDTLQEFVAANVGVTTTATTTPHNDSSTSQDDPLPASQEDSLPASQDDSLPASQDEGFQSVRNGARPTRATK